MNPIRSLEIEFRHALSVSSKVTRGFADHAFDTTSVVWVHHLGYSRTMHAGNSLHVQDMRRRDDKRQGPKSRRQRIERQ
ncbi:hypothetical protein KC329_g23 [Hortaea werneckii]|nr:hypothetical protein KC329_g23 [Hortaea werneckii]